MKSKRTRVIVIVVGSLLAVAVVGALRYVQGHHGAEPSPTTARTVGPPDENAPIRVPHEESGPQPIVVAWECSRSDQPTFVLYDDGRWLRDSMADDRCGHGLREGTLTPEQVTALRTGLVDANLLSMPPYPSVNPLVIAGDSVTIAVRDGSRWQVAAVDAMHPRWTREQHVRAAETADAGSAVHYTEPVPGPFLAANDLLVRFDDSNGTPYQGEGWVVQVVDQGATGTEADTLLGTPREWPSSLPALTGLDHLAAGHPILVPIPSDSVDAVRNEIAGAGTGRFIVGDRRVSVSIPHQAIPAEAEIRALHDAFLRFAHLLPPLPAQG